MDDKDKEEARNREFLMLADQFIDLANKHLNGHDPSMVSSAFMFASSRFCAFSAAAAVNDANAFEKDRSSTLEHYSSEYRDMLEQNLAQHTTLLNDGTEES